ncbi:serine hydroxymethyltransferase [Mongoliimonas terrestris]|uniref:serine hydroxymethyltransferase n=1 Tax=Mongoliimonas terrestris TaxID=1709001 RepID=UPI000949A326|nr:serine hydroxymethyltransferase [Mongoliimonas terrestris]
MSTLHPGYFTDGLDADPALAAAIRGELHRQNAGIELIASENIVSRLVLEAQGSVLTNKTVEGLPYGRYYGGAEFADAIEALAVERARAVFGCAFANVQPHSGSNANAGVFLGLLKLGDTILAMDTAAGGHISHGHPATLTGRDYTIVRYGVNRDSERIDLDAVRELALRHRPRIIVAGGSAYPRAIDFAGLRAVADAVDALLMVDMAHFAGLVATGLHPHPFPHAHVVTTTTYKSLRGARGGMVLWNDESLSGRINGGIFPGVQGSVMLHAVAGKAACLGEALRPEFRAYNAAVVENARALAETLAAAGLRIVSGGTDTGLMLVDLSSRGVTGDVAAKALEAAGLAVNKNMIPFDPRPPEAPSGLRLSANAGTARGFGADAFRAIGGWIDRVVRAPGDDATLAAVRAEVEALTARHPIYGPPAAGISRP